MDASVETMHQEDPEELPDAPNSALDESTSHQEEEAQQNETQHSPISSPISSGTDDAAIAAKRAMNAQTHVDSHRGINASLTFVGGVTGRCPLEVELGKLQHTNKTLMANVADLQNEVKKLKYGCEDLKRSRLRLVEERDKFLGQRNSLYESLLQEKRQNESLREERHETDRKLQKAQTDNRQLQAHITYYKRNISTATQPADQTADDVIKDKIDGLFRSIQGFVVRTFREAIFEYDLVPEPWKIWMGDYIPFARELQTTHWYNIVISIISRILTDKFDPKYYFGMADEPPLTAAADLIVKLKPGERVETKPWLEATRNLLCLGDPGAVSHSDDKLVQHMATEVGNTIARPMHIEWTEKSQKEMSKIFASGLDLFRLLHRQPATFFVTMAPAFEEDKAQPFMPNTMEHVENLMDPEALRGREIEISVFPLVHKIGDEGEADTDSPTIVSRARVVPEKRPRPINSKRRGHQERYNSSSWMSALSPQFFMG